MRLILSVTLILAFVAVVTLGKAQYVNPNPYLFRGYPMVAPRHQQDGRFFFGIFTTFTYTVATSTTTATATTITTCTTSSTTLTTCTAGRRRRDTNSQEDRHPRGLFYEEKEEETEDGNIFLPVANPSSVIESESTRNARQSEVQTGVPVAIQPTFGAYYTPELNFEVQSPVPLSRIFLAFGTATVTVTSTSTSTLKLTALCSSTTGFNICSS